LLHRARALGVETHLVVTAAGVTLVIVAPETPDAALSRMGIGALLTLVGYSVNEIIVNFARVREVRRDSSVVHRDYFRLPASAKVTFKAGGDDAKSLIRLSIRPGETRLPPRDLPRSVTLEAAVGLNGSLAQNARQP